MQLLSKMVHNCLSLSCKLKLAMAAPMTQYTTQIWQKKTICVLGTRSPHHTHNGCFCKSCREELGEGVVDVAASVWKSVMVTYVYSRLLAMRYPRNKTRWISFPTYFDFFDTTFSYFSGSFFENAFNVVHVVFFLGDTL